ncbi:MAG: L-fucose/L-arabinose isomerase family protein [Thermoguttaceae bacterium]|nr:L-fucose/L-arabinose isomerase family protein [Thermoguttaceae bacterium]MDW8037059.1 L-fucose/L-arabinose isomerase family protein [Thermoguttaceae bacterium]
MPVRNGKIRIGFLPAHRGFFSPELASSMRAETIRALEHHGVEVVVPSPEQTKVGCVENRREAELCAELFRQHRVQGIVVGAVNFGDEQSVAWTIRLAQLDVPILIFGCQEEEILRPGLARRDSFCGLLSIGEALRQIGARYSVGQRPICFPRDQSFAQDLDWFLRVCRVVQGIRQARYGQVGTRPDAFWTCRFDEKRLQRLGPTTVVLDLSELIAGAEKMSDTDPMVRAIGIQLRQYADSSAISESAILRSAKLEAFLRRWVEENGLDALAIQCWTSIQHNYGVCTCATMSRLGDEGIPCACEADILGTLSMHACWLASGSPAALADWNNLHNQDDELVNLWHCGVFPKAFAKTQPRYGRHEIMVSSGGAPEELALGTVEFVAKPGPVTLCRVNLEAEGPFKAVLAEGQIEDNPAQTFGAYGWCRIPGLQRLYRDVLLRHFPHHVAMTQGQVGNVLWEALGNYLGMQVFHAGQETPGLYTPRLPFGG